MGNATSGMTTSQGARPSHGPPSVPGAWPRGRERLPGYRVVTKKTWESTGLLQDGDLHCDWVLRYADGIACASSTILSVHGLGQNLFPTEKTPNEIDSSPFAVGPLFRNLGSGHRSLINWRREASIPAVE